MCHPPVLFLDIDGVLNSLRYLKENPEYFAGGQDTPERIDPEAAARLEAVLNRTGAVLVLSSSWRILNSLSWVTEALHQRGVPSARFIGATPYLSSGYRGLSIQTWLHEHPEVTKFAIVDDGSDMEPYMQRLVKTTFAFGLLDNHIEQLVEMLT